METFLSKVKRKIHLLREIYRGGKIIKREIRNNSGKILILSDIGVGDRVFMLAFLKKWAETYHINNWTVLAIDRRDPLYKCFSIEENRLIELSKRKCYQIDLFCTSVWGYRFRKRHPQVFCVNAFGYFQGIWLLTNPCAYDFSSLTKAVYRIPQEIEPSVCMGCEPERLQQKLFEQRITDLKKSIIINPYAVNCNQTPISFFQKIADGLMQKGFSVLCSAVGDQKPLDGTFRVDLPLDEMLTLCNVCGMLIGARSGFMDLMAFTDADIICISNRDYKFSELFQLEKCWPQNPKIRSIYYDTSNEDAIVTQIVEHFCVAFEKKKVMEAIQN